MKFHIIYKGSLISVELISRNSNIYSIEIPGKPVFFITPAKAIDNVLRWTSIPQGNEIIAGEIGILIEEYLENNKTRSTG